MLRLVTRFTLASHLFGLLIFFIPIQERKTLRVMHFKNKLLINGSLVMVMKCFQTKITNKEDDEAMKILFSIPLTNTYTA